MASRTRRYETWAGGFGIGVVVGVLLTFLYLQMAGACQ
jgi:hypothetical protein